MKLFTWTGLWLMSCILIWSLYLGIVLIVEDAHHGKAALLGATGFPAIPVVFSVAAGLLTAGFIFSGAGDPE